MGEGGEGEENWIPSHPLPPLNIFSLPSRSGDVLGVGEKAPAAPSPCGSGYIKEKFLILDEHYREPQWQQHHPQTGPVSQARNRMRQKSWSFLGSVL